MGIYATTPRSRASIAPNGLWLVVGLALVAIWWPIAWLELRPYSDYYFFPLWLGYIVTVDSLVRWRTGTSPITRAGWRIVWMFAASSALWWVFELINQVVGNWSYQTPVEYNRFEYFLLASVAFSTVIPAVCVTAEFIRSFGGDPLRSLPRLRITSRRLVGYHLVGWTIIALTIIAPSVFFPLVWFSLIFLLDPIVTLLGGRSIARYLERGEWSIVFNLGAGTLICGLFWEMWNIYAVPKWTYELPYAEWLHVFEMPLLGYGGYIPFGLEVYVFYELTRSLVTRLQLPDVLVARDDESPHEKPVLVAD